MTFEALAPTINVTLNGKHYPLVFDMNTFAAYEEATKKNFFETLAGLIDTLSQMPRDDGGNLKLNPMVLFRAVSVRDLRALVWAALHEYPSGSDEPVWPLTLNQVGRSIHVGNIVEITMAVLTGQMANYPTEEERAEAGESQGATKAVAETEVIPLPVKVAPLTGEGGGSGSGK